MGNNKSFQTGCAFIAISLVFFMLVLPAGAQLYTGSVSGTVTDPSGAVITGAQVTLVDSQKGFSFTAKTDSAGRYLFRQVAPSTYKVTVEAPNFQGQRKEGITLDVNQNAAVDFSLKVGTESQVVDVVAGGVELQTQDAVTGQVVDRRFINNLPLNERSVFDLAFLAPGVNIPDTQCTGCTAQNFVSNGSRNSTADIVLDGVSASNFEQNSGIMSATYVPSVDAVEEFKIQQSSFSAEFGFTGATLVNVVTRSGTNAFHGSAYEFLRNDKLDANEWFAAQNGESKPPLRYNNFGFTIGGPIRKNKTFFFFDYDGTRTRSFASATSGVPTALERTGDFSELCALQGGTFDVNGKCSEDAGQLWDPYDPTATFDPDSGGPVRNAFIPNNDLTKYASEGTSNPNIDGNLIDPVAFKLMQFFPLPNQPIASADDRLSDWHNSGTSKGSNNQYDIKVDQRFSDRSLLSVKYSQLWANHHDFNCYGNVADNCSAGPRDDTAHLFAINETYTFSPTIVMNVSYGYTRAWELQHSIVGDFPNLDPVAMLGEKSYMTVSGFPQFPNVSLSDYDQPGDANIGTQTYSYWKEGSDTHHLVGTLSWVRGRHELKFGGEWRVHRMNWGQPGYPGGQFTFDYGGSSQQVDVGGDPMASFLMGVGSDGQYEVPNFVSTQNHQFGGFVQDNFRVSPKLTLNLGLRYEISLPRTERFNRQNSLDLSLVNPINDQLGGGLTYKDPLTGNDVTRILLGGEVFATPSNRYNYGTDWKDIQPRFGFAYEVRPRLVVRGGYGIFYSTPRSGAAGTGPIQTYRGYDQYTTFIPYNTTDQVTPSGTLSDPFPGTGPLLPPGATLGALNDVGFDGAGAIKAITNTPYEQSWSLGIQKELPWKVVLDMNYVGKKGTHLYFSQAGAVNHLGPWVEKLAPADIGNLVISDLPNPFLGVITDPNSALSGDTIQRYQVLRPYPQFTFLEGDSPPVASSTYHAFQLRAEKAYANGLEFLVSYTWSKSIDNASATDGSVSWLGGYESLQDPNRPDLERSVSSFDLPHVLQFSYVYSLPFGRGKRFGSGMSPVANAFLGGWQLNGIWRFASGRPIHLELSGGNEIPTYGGRRPNLNGILKRDGNPSHWVSDDPDVGFFANALDVLSKPADYTIGNAPRLLSNLREPGVRNSDMSLFKEFALSSIREGMRLEYRLEAFNTFNRPQFCGPNSRVRFSSDGTEITNDFGKVTETCGAPREVQMALKFYW
jgi:hypothetical protein